MDGPGHYLNATTGQIVLVTTHNDWIRNAANAASVGLPDDFYRQIMLLPDTAIDEIRILALKGGLVRIRQHKWHTSVQFWTGADQVGTIVDAVVKALAELKIHPDERLEIGNLCLDESVTITFRALQARDQAMFQATVQPLRALGLVESRGERFNAFSCTHVGQDFIEAVCADFHPYNRSVLDHLVGWAKGIHDKVDSSSELTKALSPLELMSKSAREFLRERIVQGTGTEASRRRKALDWIERLRNKPRQQIAWDAKPAMLDESHWHDLHAGALFFTARDAAIALLDQIESHIANEAEQQMSLDKLLPEGVVDKMGSLREHAQAFVDNEHDPSPGKEATMFCRECTEQADASLLEKLLAREGRVLQLRGRDILPGVAFRGVQVSQPARSPEEDGAEAEVEQTAPLPEGISHRVRNLFLLNLDLCAELNHWLGEATHNDGEE